MILRFGIIFKFPGLKARGLQLDTLVDFATSNYRRVWVFESTRASQLQAFQPAISRTVFVRMGRVATRSTNKAVSRLSVCLLSVTALTARLAGKSRVNPQQRNASARALVFQKGTQLCKRPTVQLCSLVLPSPDPRTDTSEVFDGDHSICAFGERHNASRNYVIRIFGKPLFFAAAFLEQTLGGLRSDALQFATKCAVAMANLVQFCTTVFVPIRVHGYFHDAKVNAKNVNRLDLFFFRHFNCDIQEPLPLVKDQIRLAARIGEQGSLPFAANKRHLGTSFECPNAYGGRQEVQAEDAGVVSNAAMLAKHALNLLIQLVGVNDLSVEKAHDLSGQRKFVPNLTVVVFVQRKAAELLRVPSELRQPVCRAVHRLQRLAQSLRLFERWQQFNLDGQFHFSYSISKP